MTLGFGRPREASEITGVAIAVLLSRPDLTTGGGACTVKNLDFPTDGWYPTLVS
jgi:hypothetical protein